jgi:hypothetical protein
MTHQELKTLGQDVSLLVQLATLYGNPAEFLFDGGSQTFRSVDIEASVMELTCFP